jgi:hypothetical protein
LEFINIRSDVAKKKEKIMKKNIIISGIIVFVLVVFYKIESLKATPIDNGKVRVKYKAGFQFGSIVMDFSNGIPSTINIGGGYSIVPVDSGTVQLLLTDSKGITLKSLSIDKVVHIY